MRTKLITVSLTALWLLQSPAHAQVSVAEDIIARIEAEGYTVTNVTRSWFGRIVITANNNTDLREVVLNRTSGEILRDQRFPNENVKRENVKGDRAKPQNDAPRNRDSPGKPGGHDGPGGPGGPDGRGGG